MSTWSCSPGRYTLLDQCGADDLLPAAPGAASRVVAAGVVQLRPAGHPRPVGHLRLPPAPGPLLDRALRIAAVCARHDVTLPQAALAFPLRHPAITSVVIGARSAAEVTRNATLTAKPVPEDLWTDLAAEGLIPG